MDVTVDPSVLDIELALGSAPLEHWRELRAALADVDTEHRHRVDAVGPIERVSNACAQICLMAAAAGVGLRLVASSGSGRLALEQPGARLSG